MKVTFRLAAVFISINVFSVVSSAANMPITIFESICSDNQTEVIFRMSTSPSTDVLFHRDQYILVDDVIPEPPISSLFIDTLINIGINKECAELLVRKTPRVSTQHDELIARVNIGLDESSLTPTGKKILAGIIDTIHRSDTPLSIEGHTDTEGSHQYNLHLGLQRANAVKNYLAHATNKKNILTSSSRGETQPIAKNNSISGMAQNRRVEVHVDAAKNASHKQIITP